MSVRSLFLVAMVGVGVTGRPIQAQSPELQQKINTAIDGGVEFLKNFDWRINDPEGQGGSRTGAMALAGWTLLESGVDPKDKSVQQLAEHVRQGALNLTFTYSISLTIFFLDKLGDPGDFPLIESLATRVIGGQNKYGGWGYHCPGPDAAEFKRLQTTLETMNKKRADGEVIEKQKELSPEIVKLLKAYVFQKPGQMMPNDGDNSNTQFAMMAMWVARRHGLPVQGTLNFVDQRFRAIQLRDSGAWGYLYDFRGQGGANPATGPKMGMTAAGLLALAIGHGNANVKGEKKNLLDDPSVKGGLKALGDSMTKDVQGPIPREPNGTEFYFLWSLERMAVIYDLKTIGDKEWYVWGAEFLVENQNKNTGMWKGNYSTTGSDTCFALLFLKRANIAPDLLANLQGQVKVPPKAVPPDFKDKDFFPKDLLLPKDTKKNPKKQSRLEDRGPREQQCTWSGRLDSQPRGPFMEDPMVCSIKVEVMDR